VTDDLRDPVHSFDLSGTVAVVTGGNSGIGLGIARGLAGAGADVAIWARNEARNRAAVEELAGLGPGRNIAVCCDVTDEDQVRAALDTTVSELGRVDTCVANAGGGHVKAFVDLTLDEWDATVRLDLTSVFLTFAACARRMIEQGDGGALVAVSSIGTIFGMPNQVAYSASKGGVEGLVRSVAVELARHGIRANTVQPGWIETPMTRPLLSWERFDETIRHRTPARRWGRPDDLASAVVYLASPGARFHTGDTLRVDGGYAVF